MNSEIMGDVYSQCSILHINDAVYLYHVISIVDIVLVLGLLKQLKLLIEVIRNQ